MNRIKSFDNNANTLFLIATPIGNLKEMTPRALEIISSCDIVAAEDTRNSSMLLSHFDIKKKCISLREHNEKEASLEIIKLIKEGKKVVYMSDAGYPSISDPGFILVQECIKNEIPVSTVCGSSAFLNALTSSGINTEHFTFYGFLSSKESESKKELEKIKLSEYTTILYESPHRIKTTIKNMYEILGDRYVVIGRELTKINEEFIRGKLSELVDIDEKTLKGEMAIIIEASKEETSIDDQIVIHYLKTLINKGISKKDSIEITSKLLNINKNKVYDFAKNI